MLIVVAIGGNAVSPPDRIGNIADQFAATRLIAVPLADLIMDGHRLVITHGNGPQVGNVMRRVEIAAEHNVYPLPLDIVVADTEAGMGYMICQCLMNELASRGRPHVCTTIITTVRVDANDPAMASPTKPVGPYLTPEQAQTHAREHGWTVKEEPHRGWRRVVPSPRPEEIVELEVIRNLVLEGQIVVAAGGGGIPVVRRPDGQYRGLEAVIDKDFTSGLLAAALGADRLVILTGVDRVQRDFGRPTATPIDVMTPAEAERLMAQGQFPAGSMAPKIQAAVDFVRSCSNPAAEALITSCERAAEAFLGQTGTRIIREARAGTKEDSSS
jgi:carbamate kinase